MVVSHQTIASSQYVCDNDKSKHQPKHELRSEKEESELFRLKELLPTINVKNNVTQLDIVLEAIRYIDQLKARLLLKDLKKDEESDNESSPESDDEETHN